MPARAPSRLRTLRLEAGRQVVDRTYGALSVAGNLLPQAKPARHGLERINDLAYGDHPAQRLDIYRPIEQTGPLPVVLYFHGGGFRALSKDTHWLMGLAFARRGYLVLNVNYRLAPEHPYPAAIADACAALAWASERAGEWGGDLERLIFAGESAGGKLTAALAVAACQPRPEPWAQPAWTAGCTPRAAVAACGILQVSDAARLLRRRRMNWFVADRLLEVEDLYLRGGDGGEPAAAPSELADPLLVLEGDARFPRPLPAFFLPVGTRDPLLDDTRRMAAALERRGVAAEARYYPGEIHAFHALVWRSAARRCWRETFDFLGRVLGG